MKFTKTEPYNDSRHWFSGVYKITRYGRGNYGAYYITPHAENWGDYVSPPPDRINKCWPSLASAKSACKLHSNTYDPSAYTIKRAAAILAVQLEQTKARLSA